MKKTAMILSTLAIATATALPAAAQTGSTTASPTYGSAMDSRTTTPGTVTRNTRDGVAMNSARDAEATVREGSSSGMGAGTDANASMRSVPHGPFPRAADKPSSSGMGAGTDANASPRSVPLDPRRDSAR